MPEVSLSCVRCLLPFDPLPYLLNTEPPGSWVRKGDAREWGAYEWHPRAGTCQDERHYPGFGEED